MLLQMQIYEALNRVKWRWKAYTVEHSVILSICAVATAAAISMTAIQFFEFIL